jgi:hypothetical protein
MGTGNVNYKVPQGNPDITGPSPIIWADCPVLDFATDPASGFHFFNRLEGLTVDVGVDGYIFGGTNADVDKRGDDAIDIETGGADNDSSFLAQCARITPALNNGKKFWFECLVANDDLGDAGSFIGLMETAGQTAEAIVDDCASIIDENYIGFRILAAAQTILDIEVNQGGGTGPTVILENAQTMVAGTYYRIGITFDGVDTLKYYVDGVLKATSTLDSLDNDKMSNKLGLLITQKSGTGAAESLLLKWSRFAGQN